MPVFRCPINGCEYQTPDVDPVVAAALVTTHATIQVLPHSAVPVALVYHLPGQRRTGSTSYLHEAIT